jgi:hypothetical protein
MPLTDSAMYRCHNASASAKNNTATNNVLRLSG